MGSMRGSPKAEYSGEEWVPRNHCRGSTVVVRRRPAKSRKWRRSGFPARLSWIAGEGPCGVLARRRVGMLPVLPGIGILAQHSALRLAWPSHFGIIGFVGMNAGLRLMGGSFLFLRHGTRIRPLVRPRIGLNLRGRSTRHRSPLVPIGTTSIGCRKEASQRRTRLGISDSGRPRRGPDAHAPR
jgi:hypothetical protein